jgi:hypothetical protein
VIKKFSQILLAVSLPALVQTASAVVLFTDNFDVNTGSYILPPNEGTGLGPNHEAANPGRQGGTLATPTLGYTFQGNAQVGNLTTLAPNSNAGSLAGDEMLLAFGASATINFNFAAFGTPIEITFDGLPNAETDLTNWFSFMVSENTGTQFVNNSSVDFGILFRANGGTQYFTDGANATTGAQGPSVGQNLWEDYRIVLSDAAGTGSAFGTGSSRVDYYQNGALLGTVAVSDPFTAGQGYFGFGGGGLAGIDNIAITSVPEPMGTVLLSAGLGLMMFRRRRA